MERKVMARDRQGIYLVAQLDYRTIEGVQSSSLLEEPEGWYSGSVLIRFDSCRFLVSRFMPRTSSPLEVRHGNLRLLSRQYIHIRASAVSKQCLRANPVTSNRLSKEEPDKFLQHLQFLFPLCSANSVTSLRCHTSRNADEMRLNQVSPCNVTGPNCSTQVRKSSFTSKEV